MIRIRFSLILSVVLLCLSACSATSFFSHFWHTTPAPKATAPHYVIVGASAAGIAAAQELRKLRDDIRITVIDAARELPYNTCKLPSYLAGKKDEHGITIYTQSQAASSHIVMRLGVRVKCIDRDAHTVTLDTDEVINYEKLFLATGTRPSLIPCIDQLGDGVYTLNTLEHAQNMKRYIERSHVKRAVVVGTGFTGLECAEALVKRGIAVTLIARADQITSGVLDKQTSDKAIAYFTNLGIDVRTNCQVTGYTRARNGICVQSVQLSSGESVDAQLLVIAAGVKQNIELAQQAGLTVSADGINVDQCLRTSDSSIYAGGDVAAVKHSKTGAYIRSVKWSDAKKQGKIAAHNMVCPQTYLMKTYEPRIIVPGTSVFGLSIAGAGIFDSTSLTVERYEDPTGSARCQAAYLDEHGTVKGLCRIGKHLAGWDALKASYIGRQPLISHL